MAPDYSQYTNEELIQGLREDQERFNALTPEEYLTEPDSYWCKWPYAGVTLLGRKLAAEHMEILLNYLLRFTQKPEVDQCS